jgi:hypothetical protein
MAKKKTHKKKTGRRRRVSGIGNMGGVVMQVLGIGAGAFAASALNKAVGPRVNPKLLNAGLIVGGAMLVPKFIKGPIGQAAGAGLVAVGTISMLKSFGVISGIGDDTLVYAVNGTGDEANLIGDADDDTYGMSNSNSQAYDDGVSGISEAALISGFGDDE